MSDNPFLNRANNRKIGHNGRHSEKKLAKRMGGRLTPASGAMEGAKGDMVVDDFLIEAKATQNRSMSLDSDWLYKIYQEALELGKYPALAVTFTNNEGQSEKRERWVMVPEHVFKQILDRE